MLARAQEIAEQLVAWRRDFHMHPELGFQEIRTAERVSGVLAEMGYRVRTGVGRTGVVGDLGSGHPIVALRADMDALPIQEANDIPYASQVSGVMHACGHDAHTAMALGVATLLARESFPGTVRFLFQPSEEGWDAENVSGAPRMISDGAMEGVDAVLAQHVDAELPVGSVTAVPGPTAAGSDAFNVTIVGRGGHGASPHKVVDPIHIAGHIILALHGIVSRRIPPDSAAVISIGSIHGGQAGNVIPQEVTLTGTIRYRESGVQTQIHSQIELALGVARAMGGDYRLKITRGYPPMVNHPDVIDVVSHVARDLLGKECLRMPEPNMGSEDFGYFSSLAPGAMFMLGALIEGDERNHHNPRFDIDERCLPLGVGLMAEAALRLLRRG